MDNFTIKKLLLEKICYTYVPKIGGYLDILYGNSTHTWKPNFRYLEDVPNKYEYEEFSVTIDDCGNIKEVILEQTQRDIERERAILANHRIRAGIARVVVPDAVKTIINHKNVETSILNICKAIEIKFLVDIGLSAIAEIEHLEKESNIIGGIKKILGLNKNADLFNLETRKVLLEITRN